MQKTKKKNLLIAFDEQEFLECKKILFKKNLSPQQLMIYLFHQILLEDDEINKILDDASKFYSIKITEQDRKNMKIINHDILYDIIEQEKKS